MEKRTASTVKAKSVIIDGNTHNKFKFLGLIFFQHRILFVGGNYIPFPCSKSNNIMV